MPDQETNRLEPNINETIRRLRAKLETKRQSPVSLAAELLALKERSGLSWRGLERRVGLSSTHRKLLLSILALPEDMAHAVRFRQSTRKAQLRVGVSLKHARSLYLLRDRPEQQRFLYNQITQQQPSANQALRTVLAERQGKSMDSATNSQDPNLQAALDRLRYKLGTRVDIRMRPRGGEFVIEFYDEDDLVRVYDLLMG